MAHDVFISYSRHNRTIADAICAGLETKGMPCWIAPRDISPGSEWTEAIARAIQEARTMVLVFSGEANSSHQVYREVEQATNTGLAIVAFRIEDVQFCAPLAYFLNSCNCVDAIMPPLQASIDELAEIAARMSTY